jgi:hypothetical protein
MMAMNFWELSVVLLMVAAVTAPAAAANWTLPAIELPARAGHPVVACRPEELGRLRAAWAGGGDAHAVVAEMIAQADLALKTPLTFPPRGGQHNQWYQCDVCQVALVTIDDTHHRCPECGRIYTGEPYDDVIFAHRHTANLKNMTAAAWAYAITGKAAYADFARSVLVGYAQRYLNYPYHTASRKPGNSGGHLMEQTLNEAADLTQYIAPSYDLVWEALSAADRKDIESGLIRPMLENMDRHKAGKSNWQSWHNAGMLWGGAVIGDVSWVRKALSDPENGFGFQMEHCVSAEGMWEENSWGYHFYTLSALTHTAEAAGRLGIDLWSNPALKAMYLLPAHYMMPDGMLPRFGDDVGTSPHSRSALFEAGWDAYHDLALLPLLSQKTNWERVLLGDDPQTRLGKPAPLVSEVFPGAGHVILRGGGPAHLTAAMTFGPYGGFHGHLDKLSFVLYGYGKELGVDPGRAKSQAYRLPIHKHWYKATVGHNAVLVDGASQSPAGGALELFQTGEGFWAAAARCDGAYPGVAHRRLLCVRGKYLLVVDELSSDKPHRYDWIYHNRGSSVRCAAATESGGPREKFAGMEYIQHVRSGRGDGTMMVRFEDKPITTYLTLGGGEGTDVLIGDGVGGSIMERIPLAAAQRQGKQVTFAAAIEPVRGEGGPTVKEIQCRRVADGLQITVARESGRDVYLWTPGKLTVQSDGDSQ